MELSLNEVIEATAGKVIVEGKKDFNKICIDTRKIEVDNLYLAINGERFNGNKFVLDAFKKGAKLPSRYI